MKFRAWMMVMAAAMALTLWGAAVRAEEGITVQGGGEATGKPTEVEITASLTGDGELATDATVKFRDAKKRALAAIAGLKNPDISVVTQGVSITNAMDANTQMMLMRGQAVQGGTQKVQVRENDRIVLAHADKLEPDVLLDTVLKILDTAKDAGFQIGGPMPTSYYEMQQMGGQGSTIVAFRLPELDALREQAYKAAVADARAKAQRIADLTGVKLGRILSVTEGEKVNSASRVVVMNGNSVMSEPLEKGITGNTSGDLTLRVNLTVLFEIAK
ncbi:MAG TPA: SIMPL domain-containing protein [Phycisphaerae bacterium]|nr:SIMPL domain-containing protein [Phycisphaerae bacterium]